MANIYMALAAAQADMGPVSKGATNPHYRTKYADLEDVMRVALPALNGAGIAAWHSILPIEGVNHMRTTLSHGESDTHIVCDVPLIVAKNDMQGMKSATTYAKRIGIESLTGIAPADDDGNDAAAAPPKAKTAPPIDPEAINIAKTSLGNADTLEALRDVFTGLPDSIRRISGVVDAKDARKADLADMAHDAAVKENANE